MQRGGDLVIDVRGGMMCGGGVRGGELRGRHARRLGAQHGPVRGAEHQGERAVDREPRHRLPVQEGGRRADVRELPPGAALAQHRMVPRHRRCLRDQVIVGGAADPCRPAGLDGEVLAVQRQPQCGAARVRLSRRRVLPPRLRPSRARPERVHVCPRLRFVPSVASSIIAAAARRPLKVARRAGSALVGPFGGPRVSGTFSTPPPCLPIHIPAGIQPGPRTGQPVPPRAPMPGPAG